ncbi:MAG TPA: DUF2971 domain-containing protein [Phenylobacterium sp.]|nr:DUF2971 domain-containing protein [Phenylobacterium sp.]
MSDLEEPTPEGVRLNGGQPYRLGFLEVDSVLYRDGALSSSKTRRIGHRENVFEFGGPLYHYTSIAGLQGIISTNGFWASDNRFMNDAEELDHGLKLAAFVAESCGQRTQNREFGAILERLGAKLSAQNSVGNLVACFSRTRDSLEQWRGYGPSGAVCIKVDHRSLEGERPLFAGPDLLPRSVLYKKRPKLAMLLSVIRRFEEQYDLDRKSMTPRWPNNHDDHYERTLLFRLSYFAAGFKNPAFIQENEVRLVISHSNADRFNGLKFRASPFGLVPYINTGDYVASGRLPIREILIGPSPHQGLMAASVRTFIDSYGYTATKIELSEVPFRAS